MRPSWDEQGIAFAQAASIRGDCTRRQVGAAILDKGHRIIGAGYNGSYSGGPSCLAGECPRGQHYQVSIEGFYTVPEREADRLVPRRSRCACGEEWPCAKAVSPGSSYDTGAGQCVAVHAEINALLDVSDRQRLVDSTMFVTDAPCDGCLKIIKNTAIARIVWPEGEWVR